jgi:hypothetical protein
MRARSARAHASARARLAVLSQDEFWVPAAAWGEFVAASTRGAVLRPVVDGGVAVTAEARTFTWFTPDFSGDAVLRVAELDAARRAAIVSFVWRRWSTSICVGMSSASLHLSDPFGDVPDDVFDEAIEADMRYLDLVSDADARYRWLNSLPLVAALRASIVADRPSHTPVLLGAEPAELLVSAGGSGVR